MLIIRTAEQMVGGVIVIYGNHGIFEKQFHSTINLGTLKFLQWVVAKLKKPFADQ